MQQCSLLDRYSIPA